MLSFLHLFSKPPSLKHLPLNRYQVDASLDRLVTGVDNIHIDVHISPHVQNTVRRTVALLVIKHSGTEPFFKEYQRDTLKNEINTLRNVCGDVLLDGINRAKSASEVQIDFLGQASLAKLFLEEIRDQYEIFITKFKEVIRNFELSHEHDSIESFKMKEKLNELKFNQKRILLRVGDELFRVMTDVTERNLRNMRQSNFRPEHILPDNFFLNPVLYTDDMADDLCLLEAYVLMGQRSEDPDHYQKILSLMYDLLEKTDLGWAGAGDEERTEESVPRGGGNALDPWIMDVDNMDRMFNYVDSRDRYERFKKNKESRDLLNEIRSQMNVQKRLLDLFYRRFKKSRVMARIVAAYEMRAIYGKYCPPLRLHQVREFLVERSSRKPIARQLRSWKPDSLVPLQDMIRQIRKCSVSKRKQHLLCFLKDFSRYHRDLQNYRLLRGLMDRIGLVKEEKILVLSRENRSLYEYLLPAERVNEERPIANHVIVKADIRGSVDITHTMVSRGLNPASYFSLHFFDPISEILCDYGGSKEFIEGDAIILSIFEHEGTPQGWYGVARACGLAVRMLQIVQQYNVKSQKHDLPILELGFGICYKQGPPMFLFDGDSRIIISPAINLADRLSSCHKTLRKRFKDQNRKFNLYVFQDVPEEAVRDTADDLSLRYNLNGIELSREGFAKLSQEINLQSVPYRVDGNETVTLYTGTVPTLSGGYQRLVIREASVLQVKPDTMEVVSETPRKYYEVCAQPEILEFIRNNVQA
jgi:class 3 adenylate cyclase